MPGLVLAEGVVEVTADGKDAGRQIVRDIEGVDGGAAGQSIGRSVFGGVVGAWAAIGGTQLATDFFVGAIGGASDLNETMSKSTQIFGAAAPAIEAFGNNAAKSVGLSKEAAIGAAAGFGDMFSQLGFATDAAAAMSQQVVIAAADLGSFNNLETADVAERMSAAFRGEYDSLQAVIPNINAARVAQEAMDLGLVSSTVNTDKLMQAQTRADLAQNAYNDAVAKYGAESDQAARAGLALSTANDAVTAAAAGTKDEITGAASAQAVLSIIQKDGARAMGDFARTSDGAANKQKIMTASLEDQQAKLGGLLLPAWSGFLSFLTDSVIPAFGETVDWISKNGDTLAILAGVIGGAALAYYGITTAMGIYKAFQIASAAATGGLTIAQWALNAAMAANPIGLIITAIAALVAGIVWVATQTTFFQDVWNGAMSVIGTVATWLWENVLNPVFTAIGNVFSWIYNVIIVPIVTGIMLYIGLWAAVITWLWETAVSPVLGFIGAGFKWIGDNVIGPVAAWISERVNFLGLVFQALWALYISPAINAIGSALNWVWNSIISPVFNAISSAVQWVGSTIRGAFEGVAGFIGNAFNAVLGVVRGPINGLIGLVNSAIRGLNSLSVKIPDWVPIVGGQTWGLSLPTIPMLAKGGVIRTGGTVLVGERGPEFLDLPRGAQVTPLDRPDARPGGGGDGGVHIEKIEINEAEDPLGTTGRIAADLRKWRNR